MLKEMRRERLVVFGLSCKVRVALDGDLRCHKDFRGQRQLFASAPLLNVYAILAELSTLPFHVRVDLEDRPFVESRHARW